MAPRNNNHHTQTRDQRIAAGIERAKPKVNVLPEIFGTILLGIVAIATTSAPPVAIGFAAAAGLVAAEGVYRKCKTPSAVAPLEEVAINHNVPADGRAVEGHSVSVAQARESDRDVTPQSASALNRASTVERSV